MRQDVRVFLEDIDNVEGLEKSLEKDLVDNRISLDGSLLKNDIESFVKFENFQNLITQLTDLKEFFSYRLDSLRETASEALIQQLRDEIAFLREESKSFKNLIKNNS